MKWARRDYGGVLENKKDRDWPETVPWGRLLAPRTGRLCGEDSQWTRRGGIWVDPKEKIKWPGWRSRGKGVGGRRYTLWMIILSHPPPSLPASVTHIVPEALCTDPGFPPLPRKPPPLTRSKGGEPGHRLPGAVRCWRQQKSHWVTHLGEGSFTSQGMRVSILKWRVLCGSSFLLFNCGGLSKLHSSSQPKIWCSLRYRSHGHSDLNRI